MTDYLLPSGRSLSIRSARAFRRQGAFSDGAFDGLSANGVCLGTLCTNQRAVCICGLGGLPCCKDSQ